MTTPTTPTNVDPNIPEVWARNTLSDHLRAGFWGTFVGDEGSGMPIIQKTELLNSPGDTIHITTSSPLVGSGVSGDTTALEGSEEALSLSEIKCVPTYYRHAVRMYRRANKKTIMNLREEGKSRLAEWGGQKQDALRFAAFNSAADLNGETYTPTVYVVGGGTAVTDVGSGDTLSVVALQTIKLTLRNARAKPMIVQGREIYAGVVHPNTLFDLKRESEYRDWVKDAEIRGKDNPFFVGATAMVDGVLLFEHENVPTVASNVKVSKNVFFGAEAFVEAVDENVSWAEQSFDYGNNFGIAYGFACQSRRGLEKNSLNVFAAAVDKT